MKHVSRFLLLLLLLWMASGVWAAGEAEQVVSQWVETYNKGDIDSFVALYADDAHVISAISPFRLEGKGAIRANIARIFEAFPTRRAILSHVSMRVYDNSTAIATGYVTFVITDRRGETRSTYNRFSFALAKIGGKWLAVNTHISRLPASP